MKESLSHPPLLPFPFFSHPKPLFVLSGTFRERALVISSPLLDCYFYIFIYLTKPNFVLERLDKKKDFSDSYDLEKTKNETDLYLIRFVKHSPIVSKLYWYYTSINKESYN